jgi:hypothetical protein
LKRRGFSVKVKVLKTFKDKHSGEIHEEGKVFVISKERFYEILKVAPLIEEVETKKKSTAK